jgi:hypothetical protein
VKHEIREFTMKRKWCITEIKITADTQYQVTTKLNVQQYNHLNITVFALIFFTYLPESQIKKKFYSFKIQILS